MFLAANIQKQSKNTKEKKTGEEKKHHPISHPLFFDFQGPSRGKKRGINLKEKD